MPMDEGKWPRRAPGGSSLLSSSSAAVAGSENPSSPCVSFSSCFWRTGADHGTRKPVRYQRDGGTVRISADLRVVGFRPDQIERKCVSQPGADVLGVIGALL